jgi:hypothetical protein
MEEPLMAKYTITQALRQMQRLSYADAGRLVGVDLHDAWRLSAAKTGAPGWPPRLNELLAARTAGTVTATTPVYLVLSEGFPVCWLTVDGVIVVPEATLTRTQAKHQQWATAALADLYRHTLGQLANLRDARDGRDDDMDHGYRPDRVGSLRVANPDEPARAWWVPITGDLHESQRHVVDATGTQTPIIITAHGYGQYGRDVRRPQLDVLCAINRTAVAHDLPTGVVGDWLAAEGGLAGLLNADDIAAAFADAYIGRFGHQLSYTAYRLDELGWETTLRELGAIEFFDIHKFDRHLFTNEVRAIRDDSGGGLVVCRRHRPA